MLNVKFKGNKPHRGSANAAGYDLLTPVEVEVKAGEVVMIDTGTALEIPEGYFALALPRSSLCNKQGLRLVNSAGVIDSDYRGNIKFCYENTSSVDCTLIQNERIGQVVILPFMACDFEEANELGETERGTGGFGHTGLV